VSQPAPSTGVEITAKFFPLAFLLFFFPPTFVIDGQSMKGQWRTPTPIALSAGRHQVKVYFRYLWFMDAGVGEVAVDVTEGSLRRITYKVPWLVFLPGRMSVA
jgi:hypothetical protein